MSLKGSFSALAALVLIAATSSGALAQASPLPPKANNPIILESSGGFVIGGKIQINPNNPNRSLSCDHGYVEYFFPVNPRKTSLVMWHSSSTQVWQNRWDGGEAIRTSCCANAIPFTCGTARGLAAPTGAASRIPTCQTTAPTREILQRGILAQRHPSD